MTQSAFVNGDIQVFQQKARNNRSCKILREYRKSSECVIIKNDALKAKLESEIAELNLQLQNIKK